MSKRQRYPHDGGSGVVTPVAEFSIGGRTLSLYTVKGYSPSVNLTLYWNDEANPVQHNMSAFEVFHCLEHFLREAAKGAA